MKSNKGISLIVLIITIIIMIILSGTIILTVGNGGIIDKAMESVQKINEAQIIEMAEMLWAEAYLNTDRTKEKLEEYVYDRLESEKVDLSEYGIAVTTNGVNVVKGWIQDGIEVKKGKTVLTIGDDIEYDATLNGTVEVPVDVDWKVLGASDDGNLLIMSATNIVDDYVLGALTGETIEISQQDWLTGNTQLDGLCKAYGKGKDATGARSIKIEDVDRIKGYIKTTYGVGVVYEYSNEVAFLKDGTSYPKYIGANGAEGSLTESHTKGFYYYDGTNFTRVDLDEQEGELATIEGSYYVYSLIPDEEKISEAYKLIFGDIEQVGTSYWLASPYISTALDKVRYGMHGIEDGKLRGAGLWRSNGEYYSVKRGVRAVVSLKSAVVLNGSSDTGWYY